MRNRRIVIIAAALGVLLLGARHPTADLQLIAQDAGDPAPHRLQAAVDLGLVGVRLLVTWSGHDLR
ncbi:hypothetical protein [uncultured Sphingomonas sp.]|uniref:hypothetical protein n=1 Tax=uncultured Sphingomonas sp. TaxID=158754 RepID=UPI0035C94623